MLHLLKEPFLRGGFQNFVKGNVLFFIEKLFCIKI